MDLTRDYREFLQSLNANRVEYLLIGGWAVITYGYIRYTGDLDVWIGPGEENAARAVAAIEQFGFTDTGLTVDNFRNPRMLLVLGELPFRIEVLRTVSGVTFEECYPARVVMARLTALRCQ